MTDETERRDRGVIRWEEPPPAAIGGTGRQRAWGTVAAELRANPGRSGLIEDQSTDPSLPSRIKQGRSWWGPPGSFDATTRVIDGRIHVYAKFIGPPAAGQVPEDRR